MDSDARVIGTNDVLRFALELAALGAFGFWGWTTHAGGTRWAWAAGLVVAVMVVWGVFRVDGDPGPAPVPIPGPARLAVEFGLFGAAAALLGLAGRPFVAAVFTVLVVGHYLLARERVRWLLAR